MLQVLATSRVELATWNPAGRKRKGREIAAFLFLAPRVGFEPTTYRLTAGRSTIELSGNHQARHPASRCSEPLQDTFVSRFVNPAVT